MAHTHQPCKNPNPKSRAISLALAILMTAVCYMSLRPVASGSVTHASVVRVAQDTPTPTPTPTPDEVLEQAKREAEIAEQLKKKAQADKDRIEAENDKLKAEVQPVGAASVNIPTGSVTTDSAGWIESEMLAQEAAKKISARLRDSLCGQRIRESVAPINKLVIYNNSDLAGVELYNTVIGQLVKLNNEFTAENKRADDLLKGTEPTATPTPTPTPQAGLQFVGALAAPGIATGMIKS